MAKGPHGIYHIMVRRCHGLEREAKRQRGKDIRRETKRRETKSQTKGDKVLGGKETTGDKERERQTETRTEKRTRCRQRIPVTSHGIYHTTVWYIPCHGMGMLAGGAGPASAE